MRITDACSARRDDNVAREEQLESAGQRQTVHAGDHRLGKCGKPLDGLPGVGDEFDDLARIDLAGGVGDGFEVGARAECPAGAGQHNHPHGFVGFDLVQGQVQFVQQAWG